MFRYTGPDNLPINAPPLRIQIDGCDSAPCHVNRGESITYEVDFVAGKDKNFVLTVSVWN